MKSEGLIGCSRPSRPREENEFSEWEKTTMLKPLIPEGESLRRAFQWLADQEGHCTLKTVEQRQSSV
ncbi:MAG: hypothetical protein U5O69_10205 [Candidatus Competibacteraceae bacterium]|nr:hypothetical protein [Candidatus Competibacteraceae bacterium]